MRCAVYRNSASRRLKSPQFIKYYNSNHADLKDSDLTDTNSKDILLKKHKMPIYIGKTLEVSSGCATNNDAVETPCSVVILHSNIPIF